MVTILTFILIIIIGHNTYSLSSTINSQNNSLFSWVGKKQQDLDRVANNQQVYWIFQQIDYFKTWTCWDFVLWRVCLFFVVFSISFIEINCTLAYNYQEILTPISKGVNYSPVGVIVSEFILTCNTGETDWLS